MNARSHKDKYIAKLRADSVYFLVHMRPLPRDARALMRKILEKNSQEQLEHIKYLASRKRVRMSVYPAHPTQANVIVVQEHQVHKWSNLPQLTSCPQCQCNVSMKVVERQLQSTCVGDNSGRSQDDKQIMDYLPDTSAGRLMGLLSMPSASLHRQSTRRRALLSELSDETR